MKLTQLRSAAFALVCLLGFGMASSGQTTTVTASHLKLSGYPIPSGQVLLTPVSTTGAPIAFADGTGAQNGPTAFVCQIVNGAIAGAITESGSVSGACTVPDATQTTPANILYEIQVVDQSSGLRTSGMQYTLQGVVGVSGATWPLDHYGPPAATTNISPLQATQGTTLPSPCVGPSIFILLNSGGTYQGSYTCVGGVEVAMSGSGGGSMVYPASGVPVSTGSAWGTSLTAPTSGLVGLTDTQSLTNKTVDGVSPASLAYLDATSSIQTQLNAKAATSSLGSAAYQPSSAFDSSGAAAAAIATVVVPGGKLILPASYTANELADFNFFQQSGSVLVDVSGKNACSGSPCNGTLGSSSAAPTWTPSGLQFALGQNVAWPAGLNGGKSYIFAVYLNTYSDWYAGGYPALLTSSTGNGTNLLLSPISATGGISTAFLSMGFYSGSTTTGTPATLAGFHVLGFDLGTSGTSVDHWYIDGVEQAYTQQLASWGLQTSGNSVFGTGVAGPWGSTSGFSGVAYRALVFSSNLTAAQEANFAYALRADVENRGGQVSNPPIVASSRQALIIGDSMAASQGNTTGTWPSRMASQLQNQAAYNFTNLGLPATQIQLWNSEEATRAVRRCKSNAGNTVVWLMGGTNDAAQGRTGIQIYQDTANEVQQLKQAGCIVFVGTMIDRITPGITAIKDVYDPLIRMNIIADGADGIFDDAAISLLGADGAASGSGGAANFQDGIHPNDPGYGWFATAGAATANYYFGYKQQNPHPITTLPATLTWVDGYNDLAPTSAGQITLPDCTGPSGAKIIINNPQSTFAITVIANNAAVNGNTVSQTINGSTGAVTIPSLSTVTLRDVPNPLSTSGCHWEM